MDDCADGVIRVGDRARFYEGVGVSEVVDVLGAAQMRDERGTIVREHYTLRGEAGDVYDVWRAGHAPMGWQLVKLEKP